MYEFDITRWFEGPNGPFAEVTTWRQHFDIVDGVAVARDPRARALGALHPVELSDDPDLWFLISIVGADAVDLGETDLTVPVPVGDDFWAWFSLPIKAGWTQISSVEYAAAVAARADDQQQILDDGAATTLSQAQAQWDAKSALLVADGLGTASIEALLGPRPA